MSAQSLIETLEKLLELHYGLHKTALEKTEAIRQNDMQALTKLLREEQKLITSIQISDQKRQKEAAIMMNNQKNATVSEVILSTTGEDKEQLERLQDNLTNVIADLKETNTLNQQLLQYSLQFVNMSLDILAPESELPNYTKTQNEGFEQPGGGRSIFDSKA